MSYSIIPSTNFKKNFKKYLKNMSKKEVIKDVIKQLSENGYKAISPKMLPHKLKGNYKGCWECHIQPDLILIWEQEERITGNSTNCSGKSF
jgi:mRNA interferase YafQ